LEAVSKQLHKLIIELQSLPSLNDFVLAGGTCLALRFNHRISHDIDLFSNKIMGEPGLQIIADEHLALLLEFDNISYASLPGRPSHSTDRIELLPHSTPWPAARSSWIRKVKRLMKEKGYEPPKINPIN
jgi:hypothetical protein